MSWRTLGLGVLLVAGWCGALGGEMVTCRLRPAPKDASEQRVRFDLSAIPAGAAIYRADLLVRRTAEITGRDEEALVSIEIVPVFESSALKPSPLELRPPWFDRLDATDAARQWLKEKGHGAVLVKACPRRDAAGTCLDVAYEGKAKDVPAPVKRLEVTHRAGQTFIVFEETDDRSADEAPSWSELKDRIEKMDARREVRYRVLRHTAPITPASLAKAEVLGDVKPMSAYNVRGRCVDQLIALHRRRAIDDTEFAKACARRDYFSNYHPDMPEMGELPVARLAIADGKPLPPRMGLYVHHPREAGKAYYAVVAVADGVANTLETAASGQIDETVGRGEPVFQGKPDVTVFYDYPGERRHYVQWAAPPLANLPNQYYNWGVFVPRGYGQAEAKRLSVFFHDARQRYLKPPWPHRQDTVLLSPHDGPYPSYGYGHHESLGTLRSLRQGRVRPTFGRRVDAVLDWAIETFGADPGRLSCGGSGYRGGTAALQYGIRRPGRIAYVMADDSPDPDPRQTPYEYSHYGRGDRRTTLRPDLDAAWGRAEWNIPAENGKPIWHEVNLVAFVLERGETETLPYLSLGAGSMHLTWKQETDLMKAYLKTRNAFMAEFFWGGKPHKPLPVGADEGDYPFEPRSDRPVLACHVTERQPNPQFFEKQFETGERGYGAGSRLNTRPRWDAETIVDAVDRLEVTIYAAKRVVHAGSAEADVTLRNCRYFRPKPRERLRWSVTDPAKKQERGRGETTVDASGLITLRNVPFGEPARLVVRHAGKGDTP